MEKPEQSCVLPKSCWAYVPNSFAQRALAILMPVLHVNMWHCVVGLCDIKNEG